MCKLGLGVSHCTFTAVRAADWVVFRARFLVDMSAVAGGPVFIIKVCEGRVVLCFHVSKHLNCGLIEQLVYLVDRQVVALDRSMCFSIWVLMDSVPQTLTEDLQVRGSDPVEVSRNFVAALWANSALDHGCLKLIGLRTGT